MSLDSNQQTNLNDTPLKRLIYRFMGIFFDYLYHQLYWTYDWVAAIVSLGRWNAWVDTSLAYINGNKIIELGHGPGHLIVKLEQAGKLAYGIDTSPQMVRIASKRLRRSSLRVNLSIAHATELPFGTEEFDHVVATFPTEYIFEASTLKEIYRVLRHGGSAIIIPVAYITGSRFIDKAASWLFKISGQAPQFDIHIVEPAIQIGFDVTINRIVLKSSEVIAILAIKT
jgi:ubiquinone/menaquinone biosynthesis C-methylase UbiE